MDERAGRVRGALVAELVKEGAKATWRTVAGSRRAKQNNPQSRLADELAKLREKIADRTTIEIGLPIPNDHFATHLPVVGSDVALIELQVALYVHLLPALVDVIEEERLRERVPL